MPKSSAQDMRRCQSAYILRHKQTIWRIVGDSIPTKCQLRCVVSVSFVRFLVFSLVAFAIESNRTNINYVTPQNTEKHKVATEPLATYKLMGFIAKSVEKIV